MIKQFLERSAGRLLRVLERLDLPSYYWTYDGKGTWVHGSPDEVEVEEGLERFFDIGLSPLGFAGRRFRDVGRLWISASPLEDERSGAYHPGQIVAPPGDDSYPEEVLDFVRWVFDEAFTRKGLRQIFSQINNAMITYGRTVQGIKWQRGLAGKHGEKVYPVDMIDYNPEFFLKDPEGWTPGIYLKQTRYQTNDLQRMPDNLFVWGTMHSYFDNPYGISEMRILNLIEKYWRKNLLFWAKGNERSGVGSYVGKYGNRLFGKGKESYRQDFFEELQKLKSDTVTITHVDNVIESLSNSIQNDSFREFHEACCQIYSVVLTASATAITDGKYGSYGKEESTTTRRKSELEQHDASLSDDFFNFQVIPSIVGFNYPGLSAYPRMQLIETELIMPTTPKDQDTREEIEVSGEEGETEPKQDPTHPEGV